MSRPRRGDNSRYKVKTHSELFRESLYGELTTPEAQEARYDELEKKKKKKGFFGHENFYFWLYEFTKKHFAGRAEDKYAMPDEVEFDDRQVDRHGRKKKKKKKAEKKKLPKAYREAFAFLGWKLDPDIVLKVQIGAAAFGIIIGLLGAAGAFAIYTLTTTTLSTGTCGDGVCWNLPKDKNWDDLVEDKISCPKDCAVDIPKNQGDIPSAGPPIIFYALIALIPVFGLAGMVYYAQKYPIKAAESERMRALTYVPEIMNYLIMKMRIQPNLERAVEFASEHGEGRIAEEFRELLWKNRVGIYGNIEEGLDDMAYRWEPYSEEFKHAVTLLRASVLIPSDAERNALYDKIIEDLLDSTKEKMERYAMSMKQPSMYLFYVAILLPLMMLIMLPVAAAFAKIPIATVPILALMYIVIFPAVTFFYSKTILTKRPGGYVPPTVPDTHPDLPPKGTARIAGISLPVTAMAIVLAIVILAGGYFLEQSLQYSEQYLKDYKTLHRGQELDQPSFFQFYVPLAIALSSGLYLYGHSIEKKRIQDKIIRMESDFKDSMYLMASRLGEKKPLEDCLDYVKKFMSESPIATDIFEKIQRNIMVLGLTLKTAIFDPTYGVLKNVPSRLMTSSFKIMVDSVDLGPEVASYSLMSVSEQIGNTQKIKELMRKLLDEVTSMMSSMATLIGPIVLGMVASLQQVIVGIVPGATAGSTGNSGADAAFSSASSSLGGFGGGKAVDISKLMAGPLEFQLIIAIYVILLAVILSYFTGKVKYGDDKNSIMLTMGKTIPVAVAVFCGALYAGQMLTAGMT